MEIKKNEKNEQKFYCSFCDFSCSAQSDWNRHILRPKHHKLANGNHLETKKTRKTSEKLFCVCGKSYTTKSGLWKHKSKNNCLGNDCKSNDTTCENISEKELIIKLVKQNTELLEVLKNGTHHTTNNTYNKTFNLQFFLNETCKEAMNIQEFIDNIEIQLNDLLILGKKGYVEGISEIITSNLKALDVSRRPIHCTDKKRDILYIKDEDKWHKDDNKSKIKNVIQKVSNKNITFLTENPLNNIDVQKLKIDGSFNTILLETFNFSDSKFDQNDNIIKNISKNVLIEKNM